MKRMITVALAVLALLQMTAYGAPKREVRSVWFTTVWGLDWPQTTGSSASAIAAQKSEMDRYLNELQYHNFNAVYFQVRGMCDAMYQSSYEPWSSALTGTRGGNPGWDPLAYMVEQCHLRGMECYAWVNPFRYKASNTTYYTSQDKALEATGWLLSYSQYTVLNPGIPDARRRIINVCREIYTNYAIDGIVFDDYFYPNGIPETSSAGDYTLWRNSGTSLSFGDWRRNNIATFMRELRAQIDVDRPDLRFGVSPAGVAYLGAAKYGISKPNVTTTDWQYNDIYSDPIQWLAEGPIDFISPQIYWATTHSTAPYGPLSQWWSNVANRFGRHFYASHAADLLNTTLSNNNSGWSEMATQINLNRQYTQNNAPGTVFYSAKYVEGPAKSGLGGYLLANSFQTKSVVPKVTWRTRSNYDAPNSISMSNGTLIWGRVSGVKSNSIVRYSVYAIPSSIKSVAAAQAADGDGIDSKYLLKVCYDTSMAIPSDKQSGYWYAVCTLDGFGYESTPKTLGLELPPSITAGQSSHAFSCEYGQYDMTTFSCTAANLTQDITVTSSSSVFQVTKTTLSRTGGWIDVKFVPTGVGTFSGTLTISSGTAKATIAMTGTATKPVPRFVEKWNFSDANGTLTFRGWDASLVRNIAYDKGKLYLVYDQKDIKVVNAHTGVDMGNLNKWRVKGGTVVLADVKMCDGKLVASNIALTANGDPFRLYVWDDDQSNPRVILDTYDFGGANRIGDYIGFSGTWNDGEFLFCSDDGTRTRLLHYPVKFGVVSSQPTVTFLTTDGSTQLKTSISTRVIPADGGYWIDGRQNLTTFVNSIGVQQYAVNQYPVTGNAFVPFSWNGSTYGLCTVYNTDVAYSKGRMRLFNADNGWTNTTTIAEYPISGMSASRTNGNGTSGIMMATNGSTVEVWLSITNQGIGYYITEGGTPTTYTVDPIKQIKPRIVCSRPSTNISAKRGVATRTALSISGISTSGDIHLSLTGPDTDKFSLSTDYVSANSEVETVYINFLSDEVGEYSAQIEATSEGCDPVTIAVTAQSTEPGYFSDEIRGFEQKWIYSETTGNYGAAAWMNITDRPARDMCLANYKLYVLSAAAWNNEPKVAVVNAYGGQLFRYLDMSDISGGETTAASIRELGGHVILSNGARPQDPLKVYKWTDDNSAPELWMQDNLHGAVQVGEIMSVYGDMTSGKVMFSNGSKVLVYPVVFGHLSSTPQVILLKKDGVSYSVGDIKGAVSVTMLDDGSFWLTGKERYAAHFDANGNFIEQFTGDCVAGEHHGTSSAFFTLGSRKYMATAAYLNLTAPSNPMTEGAMSVVDYTDGVRDAFTVCTYPEEGLGTENNTSFQSTVLSEQSTDGERLNLWLLIPKQGIAFYKFDGTNSMMTGVGNLDFDVDVDCEYYTLQGLRVPKSALVPGIYIRRRGLVTDKVVLR